MTTLAYQKTVNATWLAGLAAILLMPDILFGTVLELSHLVLELVHLLFELVESALDHLVEHLFHTDTRETQIIVFYIMVAVGLGCGYSLWRTFQRIFKALKQGLLETYLNHKTRFFEYWGESSANKFKLIAWFHIALTTVMIFGF